MRNARLDRKLYIDQSRIENDIKLEAVRTDSNVVIVGSRVTGAVSAYYFHGALLDLSRSEFRKWVGLNSAELQSHVVMDGAIFEGQLNANGMKVGGSLFASGHNGTTFKCLQASPCVILTSVNVNGQLALAEASIEGDVSADSLLVGNNLFLYRTKCTGLINMISARIEGYVDLRGATLAVLDLSEASISGALMLGGIDPKFPNGSPAI